jgi:hypothetical protein
MAGACTGPALHVDNPGGHTVYLDGKQTKAGTKPFRYYGTTRWDALPADRDDRPGLADFRRIPTSQAVAIEAPAPLWIFPFDFPLELFARLTDGRVDTTTRIEVRPAPNDPGADPEVVNATLPAIRQRASDARASR